MNSVMPELLEDGPFPQEKDRSITGLRDQVKSGNFGVSLSSFEELYEMTPRRIPFPVGVVNFEDKKRRFVFSWIEEFSKLGISGIEEYSLRLRHYPTEGYPVLSLLVGLYSGKVDPVSGEDLWYYGEIHLDISLMVNRIKLYQLLNSEEILFSLYDEKPENLDSYGFSLNGEELKSFADEISSIIENTVWSPVDNISRFTKASKLVSESFNKNGLPKTQEALQVYLRRKAMPVKVTEHNWKEYISI